MAERVLFVDLENVHKVDLTRVKPDARVLIFYGAKQKTLPEDLVVQAQPFGTRLRWIKMSGQGPNALDFHIAFYLGQELAAHPDAECTVLSGDTGFDPLLHHLSARGHRCFRLAVLQDLPPAGTPAPQPAAQSGPKPLPKPAAKPQPKPTPKPAAPAPDPFARLLTLLRKSTGRPVRYTALSSQVQAWFPGLQMAERTTLIRRLFAEGRVQESGNSLTYTLDGPGPAVNAPAPAVPAAEPPHPPPELTTPGVSV